MHEEWRSVAERVKGERARLAAATVPMLHRSKPKVAPAAVASLRLTSLLADAKSKTVRLAVFTMPSLPADVIEGPKGAGAR